ncbi:MAG: hypothetical protein ACREDP_20500, partial [Bradyrhizobium sp.]
MTKCNRDSILQSNFCDIVNYFRERKLDGADQLAQRALSILFLTDHLVQTGDELDTDPFCANMFAGAALGAISASIKNYPFVRVAPDYADVAVCETAEQQEAVLDSAEDVIEMAEGLMKELEPSTLM